MKTIWGAFCSWASPALLLLFGGASLLSQSVEQLGNRHFVYLSDKRVVTAELISETKVILNYINLDDVVEVVRAEDLLVLDSEGRSYRGHLFLNEDPGAQGSERYKVTDLIGPAEYRGYDILSDFRFSSAPRDAYLRLGARVLELQPLTAEEFDIFADNVGQIDLKAAEKQVALADAGFWQGFGELHQAGEEKTREVLALLPDRDPVPPVILASPAPLLPENHLGLADPVVVRLRAKVNAAGGMMDIRLEQGVNKELDDLAVEVVRNSWELLPAISRGQPADAELVLRVVFER